MAELKNRYAKALLDLSTEKEILSKQVEQASFICDVLKIDKCEDFLRHPNISNKAKRSFLDTLFTDKISADLMGFLYLTIEKNRESLIIPTLTSYIEMGKKQLGYIVANVVSAFELNQEQLSKIKEILSKKIKKEIELKVSIDPDLIGGFYIHADKYMIDYTIRTQLYNMKEKLKKGDVE